MNNKQLLLALQFFTSSFFLTGTEIIQGDADASEGTTFSFPIKAHIMSFGGSFYIGSAIPSDTGKEFALSTLAHSAHSFQPLAPEKIGLNGIPQQNNPLYGAAITSLSLLRPMNEIDVPVMTIAQTPAIVYALENITSSTNIMVITTRATAVIQKNEDSLTIIQSPEPAPVNDANGVPSSGVIALETDVIGHVFAAAQPHEGIFGEANSGIALITRGVLDSGGLFAQVDAATGGVVNHPKALRLDPSTSSLIIGANNLAHIDPSASMTWDNSIKRLFIGLTATANTDENDGVRAITVGTLDGGLSLLPIAPETVFTNKADAIVGIKKPNARVSASLVKTMTTSTALHYLLVLGGSTNSDNQLFALPLINGGEYIGTIANKHAIPQDIFLNTNSVAKFVNRIIDTPATTPDEMTHTTDVAAQVGGGPLNAGAITDIVVRDDTVFAYVGASSIGATGIYSSQALFDQHGKIKAWTAWQRAGGTTDQTFFGALNVYEGNILFATGSNNTTINTVQRTNWSNGNPQGLLPVTEFINNYFFATNGGIQSMSTFLPSTPGLHDIALLSMGGIGQVALIQTGTTTETLLIPTSATEFSEIQIFNNGTITEDVNATIVLVSGGALDDIGPITASAIGTDGTTGWFFVGGSNGLAVLSDENGNGWDIFENQLASHLTGITQGMSFKKIGSYSFVKKIICDGTFLYIITHNVVDRIDLTTVDFASNTLQPVTVATRDSLFGGASTSSILDGIISQACGILATTQGLFRVADNNSIEKAAGLYEIEWTLLPIAEGAGSPSMLLSATTTNREQDITKNSGGQFYVLTSNAGGNQSTINRFVVNFLNPDEAMQPTTIQPFNDIFVENIPSFFLNFGRYTHALATDGGLYFATRNQHNRLSPETLLTPPYPIPQVGVRNVGERSIPVAINYNHGSEINGLERSQASGSWIIAGNFGMQVLE